MSSNLDYFSKAWIASKTSLNSNFGDLSFKNGAISTDEITTLSDYLKKERPDKLKNWNPELNDDNRLQTTYVVPVTMPNGERIDLIVSSKGRDIAQIYVNEDPENRFHLDNKVVENILKMTGDEKNEMRKSGDFEAYKKEFLPQNIEELAEKISRDELIPKTQEQAKERKNKALGIDNKTYSEDEISKEDNEIIENKEGASVEEQLKEAGISQDAIERFCAENKINPSAIISITAISDAKGLSEMLGKDIGSSKVIAIKARNQDGGLKENSYLMSESGETILNDRKYDDNINALVPNNSKNGQIKDIEEDAQITYVGEDGEVKKADFINEGSPRNLDAISRAEYLEKVKKINEKISYKAREEQTPETQEDLINLMRERSLLDDSYKVRGEQQKSSDVTRESVERKIEEEQETEIIVTDENGDKKTMTTKNSEADARYAEEQLNKLKMKLKSDLETINSEELSPVELAKRREEILIQYHADVNALSRSGVDVSEAQEDAKLKANEAVAETDKEELKDGVKKAGSAIGEVAEELIKTVGGRRPGGRERGIDDNIDPRTGEPRY